MAVHSGRLTRLTRLAGQFEAELGKHNPIDLDLCTRCNACVDACPEGAIGLDYQVDLNACKKHRDCVRVCDAAGAIDFNARRWHTARPSTWCWTCAAARPSASTSRRRATCTPAHDERAMFDAVLKLRELTGEFDKPRFFRYDAKICAHSRNEKTGCTACIDVCSASAIRSDGLAQGQGQRPGRAVAVVVDPTCAWAAAPAATVCPSGAMSFAYPGTVDQGKRLRTMLTAYGHAGGRNAALLIHSEGAAQPLLDELGRGARLSRRDRSLHGLPARVLPVAVWHTASVGIDLWLAAIAQGASQVWVLLTDEEAPEYRQALQEQMAWRRPC
jgi:ferredoxin